MTDPAAPPIPTAAPRPRRWPRWLLIASLALNMVFVGIAIGGALQLRRLAAVAPPPPELGLLWRALPDRDRDALRWLDPDPVGRPDPRRPRDPRGAAVAELRALLVAEPFDRAALATRLTEAHRRQSERAERALERMLDRIAAMTPAERLRLAERLERRARRARDRELTD